MISIICPSRGRPYKCRENILSWICRSKEPRSIEVIISIDKEDPFRGEYYEALSLEPIKWTKILIENETNTSVAAVNSAANIAQGDILMIIGEDNTCPSQWDMRILNYTKGKTDWVLKVRDGLQNRLITLPILDRAYYNRDKFIYHPDFSHLWSDTFFSDLAYTRKRVITKNVRFPHRQYSIIGTEPDEINLKNNATYESGKKTYLELKKNIASYV